MSRRIDFKDFTSFLKSENQHRFVLKLVTVNNDIYIYIYILHNGLESVFLILIPTSKRNKDYL